MSQHFINYHAKVSPNKFKALTLKYFTQHFAILSAGLGIAIAVFILDMMYTPGTNTRLNTSKDQETNTDQEQSKDIVTNPVVEEYENKETNTVVDGNDDQEINILMDQYNDQVVSAKIHQEPKTLENFDKVNEENEDKFPETNDDTEVVLEPLDTTLLDQYISHGI